MYTYHWDDYDDYLEKYGPEKHPEKNAEITSLNYFFHGLGILVALGRIDIDLLGMHMGNRPVVYWNKVESLFVEQRKREGLPYLGIYFEYLKDEQLKRKTYPRGKAAYLAN
jgi:hypothetical protein